MTQAPRFVLVDGEAFAAPHLKQLLGRRFPGCTFEHATDEEGGRAALEKPLAALVLGSRLRRGDVMAVAREAAKKRVPTLLVTNLLNPELVAAAKEAGIAWVMSRPYDADHLLAHLARIVAGGAQAPRLEKAAH